MSSEHDLSYQSARVAMCERAGRLVAVRHGCYPELPDTVAAVVLSFESGEWLVAVCSDDDTVELQELSVSRHREFDYRDPAEGSAWGPALGKSVLWAWTLENQQGYVDGVQFSFGEGGHEVCQVQLLAIGSSWRIHGWGP